jgi:predicted transcriptional regulator
LKTLARKKNKGTELEVFSDRAARANVAILDVLAKESPQTIKQLLKQISKYEGLEEIYYASLTKRLNRLHELGYIGEAQPNQEDSKDQTSYELRMKAYLAKFLKENSIQDILDQATDTQAAYILLALLNVFLPEKDKT